MPITLQQPQHPANGRTDGRPSWKERKKGATICFSRYFSLPLFLRPGREWANGGKYREKRKEETEGSYSINGGTDYNHCTTVRHSTPSPFTPCRLRPPPFLPPLYSLEKSWRGREGEGSDGGGGGGKEGGRQESLQAVSVLAACGVRQGRKKAEEERECRLEGGREKVADRFALSFPLPSLLP